LLLVSRGDPVTCPRPTTEIREDAMMVLRR
jgi:hypothetical protein